MQKKSAACSMNHYIRWQFPFNMTQAAAHLQRVTHTAIVLACLASAAMLATAMFLLLLYYMTNLVYRTTVLGYTIAISFTFTQLSDGLFRRLLLRQHLASVGDRKQQLCKAFWV